MMKKKKDMAAAEQAPKGAAGRARAAAREESRRLKAEAEASRLAALMAREAELREAGYQAVAGLDEAGRGPLAGPVVAGAVILRPGSAFAGLNDSKKVTLANRLRLEAEIKAGAAAWAVGQSLSAMLRFISFSACTFPSIRAARNGAYSSLYFGKAMGCLLPGPAFADRCALKYTPIVSQLCRKCHENVYRAWLCECGRKPSP